VVLGGNLESDNFGVIAMLAFWGSAIGGIAFAISWAKSRGQEASGDAIRKSLEKRLKSGELTQEEYDRRMAKTDQAK